MNESFLKMQKLAGVISDTEYNETINEGIFDRVKAKVKGGAAYVGTGLSNVKKAFSGDIEGIKDPKLASNMAVLNTKTKAFEKTLEDMLTDLEKLFPRDMLDNNPEISKIISVYTQALKKAQTINQQIAAGDISKVKGISPRDSKGRFVSIKEGEDLTFKEVKPGKYTATQDFGIFKKGDIVIVDNVRTEGGQKALDLKNEKGLPDDIKGDMGDAVEVFAYENQVEESLDSAKHYWPIPPKWFNKYYTMDFYEEGPRISRNDNGEHVSFSDVIKHYESEEGSTNSLW
jgi:hypothetical protein